MIAFLRGILAAESPGQIVVDVHGVGYKLMVPHSTLASMPSIGQEVFVFTHMVVREDDMQLYGFQSEDELAVFLLLLNVSGMGPKGALSVLSVYPPDSIRGFIGNEDVTALTRVPGVGKKTAQRLILELKDKIGKVITGSKQGGAAIANDGGIIRDAEFALVALGYTQSEASDAVGKALNNENTVIKDASELIKQALKYLMKE
ncbi:Holliday junction branch migration protein RuvA [Peptococcaceae bacterium 1198_IL3148]